MKNIIRKHNELSVDLMQVLCLTVNKAILEKDYNLMAELRDNLSGTLGSIKIDLGTPRHNIESFMDGKVHNLIKVPCTPKEYYLKSNLLFKETNDFNLLSCGQDGSWAISDIKRRDSKPKSEQLLLVDSYMYYGDGEGFDSNNRSIPYSEVFRKSFEWEWSKD